ncbi:MAG: HlyC/CorC family transporter [Candidatus Dormibacteraeota bacterium]|nr:HlyC/CorC family transporter [Candidatus Dormibacteraeota bacterium]MBO0760691.1 HlyC/CorC family transporter [Candidatus Dormibacteraeota bacterium]
MLILAGLLLIVALTAATAYFVSQEFAYVAVDRARLQGRSEGGDGAAARALRVTERLSFMLSGSQLGITVTTLLAGYVAEPFVGRGLADMLGLAGLPSGVSLPVSVAVALVLATVVQMVLGELAPKNLAIARPDAIARALSRSTLLYLTLAGPVIHVFDAATNRLLRGVGIEPAEELPHGATPEELERIFADSQAGGELDAGLSRLLQQGLDFRSRTAAEVMVPRVQVVSVRPHDTALRVVELLDSGHSRFPVVGTDPDVLGVVSLAEVRDVPPERRGETPVSSIASPPLVVPASLPLPLVLERLRAGRRQLACVAGEFGGFEGIVTLEDVAEELVGPIRDEDDLPEDTAEAQPDGAWLVPALWRVDEIAGATGVALPEHEDYDTLSGLVLQRLGRLPEPGDSLDVEITPTLASGGRSEARRARLTVVTVRNHVPRTVRLALLEGRGEPPR